MRYEKFSDYMYYLLHSPFKRIKKEINQWYILFRVLGKFFDKAKKYIFLVRETSMVLSAPEDSLEMHGTDREMSRLKGETFKNYRHRLTAKMEVAAKSGTKEGIILALKTLGYQNPEIEPMYLYDPERWAEFIVYLSWNHVNESGINDITLIKSEIMKVKPASGMPSYGTIIKSGIVLQKVLDVEAYPLPSCGMLLCGVHPITATIGKLVKKNLAVAVEMYSTVYGLQLCGAVECGTVPIESTIFSGRRAAVKMQGIPMANGYNLSPCGTIYSGKETN